MAQTKYLDYAGLQAILNKLFAREFKGLGLSEENFTAELKAKYDALVAASSVEDLTALFERVSALEDLIEADSDGAINKFNEIVAFLDGIDSTETLAPIIADVAANKQKLAGIEAGAQKNTVTSVAGKTGAVTLAKGDVGLGNVDNTADADKPVSTAQQAALDGKVDKVTGKGLSTNDYDDAAVAAVATIATKANSSDVYTKTVADATFVKAVSGMGLSTNDYTTSEKAAVATIADKLDAADLVAISASEINALLAASAS